MSPEHRPASPDVELAVPKSARIDQHDQTPLHQERVAVPEMLDRPHVPLSRRSWKAQESLVSSHDSISYVEGVVGVQDFVESRRNPCVSRAADVKAELESLFARGDT